MMLQSKNLISYLFLLIPLFLVTGPAIPDIVITLGILFGIFYTFYQKEHKNFIKLNLFRISIIFWICLILISFFSYNKNNSFQDSLIFIRFLLIPFCCYFIFFENKKVFERSLIIIFFLVVFVSIDTFYQFINYTSKDGFGKDLLGFTSNWYGRLTGPFGDELIPGSYVSKFGLFGFVFLISIKKFKNNIFIQSLYLSSITLVCYISGERMAFATFSLSLIMLFIFLNEFRKTIILSTLFGTLFIFLAIYLHPFYNDFNVIESTEYHQGQKIEKFYQCENNTEKICSKIINIQPSFIEVIKNFSTSAYGEIYKLSFVMFLDNPVTGIGINNFKYLCTSNGFYSKLMVNYDCASHPHNIYLQWLTEGGIIVFISFIAYLYFLVKFIIYNTGDRKYKIISLVILLSMFWPIMSTGSLIKNWFGVISFFIIGLCMCLSKFKNNY